jgi:hypothetical protein
LGTAGTTALESGAIKLKALIVWHSVDDFGKMGEGVTLGKSCVVEGVLGVCW